MAISSRTCLKSYRNIMHNILTSQVHSLLNQGWFTISQQGQVKRKFRTQSQKLFQAHYFFFTESSFQEHSFWASKMKLALKMKGNVEGGFSSKQCLFYQDNITAVVFPKWLKLGVINHTHSALISFKIRLACDFSLKPQKFC